MRSEEKEDDHIEGRITVKRDESRVTVTVLYEEFHILTKIIISEKTNRIKPFSRS